MLVAEGFCASGATCECEAVRTSAFSTTGECAEIMCRVSASVALFCTLITHRLWLQSIFFVVACDAHPFVAF